MITETLTSKGTPAITSDHWHVVHSHFSRDDRGKGSHARVIVSEHADRTSCAIAAEALSAQLAGDEASRPQARRDQVFVRPPNFKSLKARRRSLGRS